MPTRYVHTNLIARDWRRLASFYRRVFGCEPIPPERDLSGPWLDRATGLQGAHLRGIHLRLPGCGERGPTLEIFQYDSMPEHPPVEPHTPGFSHMAFAVDSVRATAATVLTCGGSLIGALTETTLSGVGRLTFQYTADPEGNIIELQHWE